MKTRSLGKLHTKELERREKADPITILITNYDLKFISWGATESH